MKKSDIVKHLRASGLKVNNKMTKSELKKIATASGFWQDAWDVVKKGAKSAASAIQQAKPLSKAIRGITTLAAPLLNEYLPVIGPTAVEYLGNKGADYVSQNWGLGKKRMIQVPKIPKLKHMGKKRAGALVYNNAMPS